MADDDVDTRAWLFAIYEDDPPAGAAYCAGFMIAECDRVLHVLWALQPCGLVEAKVVMQLPIELLPIVDLLAMECGFTSDFTGPDGNEEDVPVTFTLGRDPDMVIDPSELDHP